MTSALEQRARHSAVPHPSHPAGGGDVQLRRPAAAEVKHIMVSPYHDRVRCELSDGVAHVSLARPDKRNALDMAMFEGIAGTLRTLGQNAELKAVVLSGDGRCFCAGIDLACMTALGDPAGLAQLRDRSHGDANLFQFCALGWRRLDVPVIAALHGAVFGGGLQVALGADIRFGAPDTQMSIMELRWNLVPDMGATVLLDGLVRDDIARELTYSARILTAKEALDLGLLTDLVQDPLARSLDLARSLAGKDGAAVRAAKRLMNSRTTMDARARLDLESAEQAILIARKSVGSEP